MAKRLEVYKCDDCGIIVEAICGGGGELVCCGKPMVHLSENTVDAAVEKHVPVIETTDECVNVKVGSVAHPMEEDHYIVWIEVVSGNSVLRRDLKPGEAPEASFCLCGDGVVAREYCNKHGLWQS